MTAKEHAYYIAKKHIDQIFMADKYGYLMTDEILARAKECALITVREVIGATTTIIDRPDFSGLVQDKHWLEVKQELENI